MGDEKCRPQNEAPQPEPRPMVYPLFLRIPTPALRNMEPCATHSCAITCVGSDLLVAG